MTREELAEYCEDIVYRGNSSRLLIDPLCKCGRGGEKLAHYNLTFRSPVGYHGDAVCCDCLKDLEVCEFERLLSLYLLTK